MAGGLAAALAVGVAASLYPAVRAARLTPTEALRAT
jgi:putative ABC transport system permease protein